jgi:glycosyltransferase involved in cell wall biosynthesis
VRQLRIPVRRLCGTDASLRLHLRHTPRAVGQLSRSAVAVRRLSAAADADVVHANSIRAGIVTAGARLLGAPPTLVHVRDRLPPGRAASLSLATIVRGNDLVVANSRYTAASMPARPSIRVVSNPVDLDRFDARRADRDGVRASLNLRDDRAVLAVIAQITPWKGQDDAIRLTRLLRDRGHRVRLLVVGAATFVGDATRYDNRAYRARLDRLVDELGLRDDVVFTGQREDVPAVLSATDVLLVPSWEEPFGRTVIEGMAMGVPVVATSAGGPAEIVTHGDDGVLVAPRRPDLWAEAVGDLLARPQRRAEIAQRGRRTAATFGRDRHVAAIVELYRELARMRA